MTKAAQKLLDELDGLPDQDRAEILTELLRRVALAPHDLRRSMTTKAATS